MHNYCFPGGVCTSKPLNARRVLDSKLMMNRSRIEEMLWGSYRPHVYFGMRPRLPTSIVAGILWMIYSTKNSSKQIQNAHLRHFCKDEDNLAKYGWVYHDGKLFGSQEIIDGNYRLQTDFIKRPGGNFGGDWTARISGKALGQLDKSSGFSLFFYVANEGEGQLVPVIGRDGKLTGIDGDTAELGTFHFVLPQLNTVTSGYLAGRMNRLDYLTDYLRDNIKQYHSENNVTLLTIREKSVKDANLIVYQLHLDFPFEVDLVFKSDSCSRKQKNELSGSVFTEEMLNHKIKFDQRFEDTFGLKQKGFDDSYISFARAALSNLVGGIGYFNGRSWVTSENVNQTMMYFPAPLYSAVPSRSSFPRGFLWDEGFHQLIVNKWDPFITEDVLAHWLDLMNADGWIPREQILGHEAQCRVPSEFIVQHAEHGNPPSFFLTFEALLASRQGDRHISFLKVVFPRLQAWFHWFNQTQKGTRPTTYYWRGRTFDLRVQELNPKTHMSGMDDYPRASHPSDIERHLDLRCWMALGSRVMAMIAKQIGNPVFQQYQRMERQLTDELLLSSLHWCEDCNAFCDYGNHTRMAYKTIPIRVSKQRTVNYTVIVPQKAKPQFVNEFGYLNLFPLLTKILQPSSTKLGVLLSQLANVELLWSDYGFRSISNRSFFYGRPNTQHDPPYWRGAIWININYLTMRALHYYGNTEGPYKDQSLKLYRQLRHNIIENMVKQYTRTGYIWESYCDEADRFNLPIGPLSCLRKGEGRGTHPFTGWSSLILLIMSESYN